ncbi:MAG: amidohydrolase [Nitrospirae bacterium]|nr:amidohydrolase [Nitrospirota bacterium]
MIEIDYILHGDYLVTMSDDSSPIIDGAVAVKNGKIVDIGIYTDLNKKYAPLEIINGGIIMPGLINTHCHAAMVYFRGYADDLHLLDWLEKYIWPAERKWLSNEFVTDAVELAVLEMLCAGITTYSDMYFYQGAAAKSVKKLGIRAVLASGVIDFPTKTTKCAQDCIDNAVRFIKDFKDEPMISPSIALHSPYTCCPDTYIKSKEASVNHNVLLQTHLSETQWEVDEILKRYGRRPVEHLDYYNILDSNVLASHCVWLDDKEIDIVAKAETGVSHCINSNLKLASGIARVPEMLNKGINVALGTDGAASNNNLDILNEMSIAARLHKAIVKDSSALKAKEALRMATINGARALGLSEKIGSIEKGKSADIIIGSITKPHLVPIYDIYSHIVYSMSSADIDTVMVDGKVLIRVGHLANGADVEIIEKANHWGRRIAESV